MDETQQVEGQYGDYMGLSVGDEVEATRTVFGRVIEVGGNYADIELENGDEITLDSDWDID